MEFINYALKQFIIFNCFYYLILIKSGRKYNLNSEIFIIITSILYSLLRLNVNKFIMIIIVLTILIFNIYKKINREIIFSSILSLILVYVFHIIPAFLYSVIQYKIFHIESIYFLGFRTIELSMIFLVYKFSHIKKFQNKLNIVKSKFDIKEYLFIIFYLLSLFLIFSSNYMLFYNTERFFEELAYTSLLLMIFLSLFLYFFIRREIVLRYKETVMISQLESKDEEINHLKEEISKLIQLTKISHETNHQIDILKEKFTGSKENLKELSKLSKKYRDNIVKISSKGLLQSTNVDEIDDVLLYMKKICDKKNIEFSIKVLGSINYMIEHEINIDTLKTMISDHVKNAIISIENSNNTFRSILLIIGEINDNYGLSVHDSGIEFETKTLASLGLKAITTHKNAGGTGMGMLTTFDRVKTLNGSIEIFENDKKELCYTKSFSVIFDNLNEYRIKTYREKIIKNKSKNNYIKFIK